MDVMAVRAERAAACDRYPQPGEVRDSILLSMADGIPAVFTGHRVAVRPAGRRVLPRWVWRVAVAVIVTDTRTALASGSSDAMLVGHILHSWLHSVCLTHDTVRLTFDHPAWSGRLLGAELSLVRDAAAAAGEIARRSGRAPGPA